MNKLALLKKLNSGKQFSRITNEERGLFLLMIACCEDNGEGTILWNSIKTVFCEDFSYERVTFICTKLEKAGYLRINRDPPAQADRVTAIKYSILVR